MNDFESMERDEPVDIEAAGQVSKPSPTVTLEDKLQQRDWRRAGRKENHDGYGTDHGIDRAGRE